MFTMCDSPSLSMILGPVPRRSQAPARHGKFRCDRPCGSVSQGRATGRSGRVRLEPESARCRSSELGERRAQGCPGSGCPVSRMLGTFHPARGIRIWARMRIDHGRNRAGRTATDPSHLNWGRPADRDTRVRGINSPGMSFRERLINRAIRPPFPSARAAVPGWEQSFRPTIPGPVRAGAAEFVRWSW